MFYKVWPTFYKISSLKIMYIYKLFQFNYSVQPQYATHPGPFFKLPNYFPKPSVYSRRPYLFWALPIYGRESRAFLRAPRNLQSNTGDMGPAWADDYISTEPLNDIKR